MFRTVMATGVLAIIGIVALKLILGIFGGLVGFFFILLFLALEDRHLRRDRRIR